jgi:hypothetical protein
MPMDREYTRRQLVQGAGAVGLERLAGFGRWAGQAGQLSVQQASKAYRLGFLASAGGGAPQVLWDALREVSYVEGENLTTEARLTAASQDGPAQARELAALDLDVIVRSEQPASVSPCVWAGPGNRRRERRA